MRVEADSSGVATGAVLSMKCEDEKWRPCAYYSKTLSETERNYDVHDRDMLAIIRALETWRHYVEGAKEKIEIWTDHKNLQYFMTSKKLNRRQARWALYLSRFKFKLVNKPRSAMGKADALSRRPDLGEGVEKDNSDVTLLKPEFFALKAMQQGHLLIAGEEEDLLSKIRKSKNLDESVIKAVEELKRSLTKRLRSEEWATEQDLVLYRGKIYVPKDGEIRREIVRMHHDTPIVGHPGRWKTQELVGRKYWWPGMTKFVAEYVKGCDKCQRNKTIPQLPAGKLMPAETPTKPWKSLAADFVMGLPEVNGVDALLVVVCRAKKQIHIIPTTKETSALGLAKLY